MAMPEKTRLKRRDFIKSLGLGAGALALGRKADLLAGAFPGPRFAGESLFPDFPLTQLYNKVEPPSRVSLVKGGDRYDIVFKSLKLIEDEVLSSIGNKKILLKPNIVLSECPLAVTHIDATRAVLDFLAPHHKKEILIAESGNQNTMAGFKNYGYLKLEKEYNVKIADLNTEGFQYRYALGLDNKPVAIRIINTFLDPDVYLISLARMKTHNYVFVTLSLKNVLVAAPLNEYPTKKNDKALMHMAAPARNDLLHFNMFHLAQEVYPDLAVIDGFEGMEGDGPGPKGTPIASRVALASLDPLAADITATRVMGFDPKTVNYLTAMAEAGMGQGNFEKISLLGTPLDECICPYKPNARMAELYKL
jgi:uncharacterized protein (DUF362 family)